MAAQLTTMKGRSGACSIVVEDSRRQALACPGLALNQNGWRSGRRGQARQSFDLGTKLEHRPAIPDQRVQAGSVRFSLAKVSHLVPELLLTESPRDGVAKILHADRLLKVIQRSELDGSNGVFNGGVGREHEDRSRGAPGIDSTQEVQPATVGQT